MSGLQTFMITKKARADGLARRVITEEGGSGSLDGVQATVRGYDQATRSGSVLLDSGAPMDFDAAAFDAGGLRLLRLGQRVRLDTDAEGVITRLTIATLP